MADGRRMAYRVAAYQDGKPIVEAQAGTMGPDDSRPVGPDTLFLSFSSTKGPAATLIHMLAERGLIEYDAPVAKYWPAFGDEGSRTHRAGDEHAGERLPPRCRSPSSRSTSPTGMPASSGWKKAFRTTPGTQTGYHAATLAWITGGIVQAVTGSRRPDLDTVGDRAAAGARRRDVRGHPGRAGRPAGDAGDRRGRRGHAHPGGRGVLQSDAAGDVAALRRRAFRNACLPSGNGHFTARALAKMYSALATDGSVDGVQLVKPETLPYMNRLVTDDVDVVLGMPTRKSIGYFLGGAQQGIHGPMGPRESVFGHPGAGGSVGFADPEARLSVGVALNKMNYPNPGEGVTLEICDAIRQQAGA
ncbi:MAG: serine hydrolase domain-containing protein [Dehalococcoidia bacterium]|nr:serine hydrolase domain-containing protein [Dehalococcoidia bacterium]